jgi:site-specific recombinase XerD
MLPLLNEFRDKMLQDGRQLSTILNTVKACVYFATWYGSEDVRKVSPKDIERYKIYIMTEFISREGRKLCNGTIMHRLSAIGMYFQFLHANKKIFFDPTLNMKFPKKEMHFPTYIPTEKDIEELINQPDTHTYVGIRDRLLLELAYTCPLRNIELRRLKVSDIDTKEQYIYPSRAKGGRECGIPIIPSTYQALEKYLSISRPRLLRKAKGNVEELFVTERGGAFSDTIVNEVFQKYRGTKHIHPHSMRHACAVHMLKNGAGVRDIQVLLGHKSLKSTQMYTMLTANDLKDLHVRYHPREKYASSGKTVSARRAGDNTA